MHKAKHIEAALKRTVGAKAWRKFDIEQQELEFIRKQMLLDQGGEQLSQINFTEALASTLLETVEDRSEVHVQLEAPVTEEPNMRMNVDSDESMVDKETQTEELDATFSVSDAKTHNEEFAVFPVSDTEALTEEFDYMSVGQDCHHLRLFTGKRVGHWPLQQKNSGMVATQDSYVLPSA